MVLGRRQLAPGTLWARVTARTEHALRCGALQSLPTAYEFVEQDGIGFLVRVLANLIRRDAAKKQQDQEIAASGKASSPFLPYDEALFVAEVSNTHVCLLNKFNVVDHHLLIVTRAFEDQESLLNLADFEALWACMAEFEGLGFYNGGQIAGASQQHKHLQLVPLPLAPAGPKIPIEPALAAARFQGPIGSTPRLPFRHAIARLAPDGIKSPSQAAAATLEYYCAMRRTVGLQDDALLGNNRQSGPYNLLVTRQWMLLVPRSQECFQSISVNALGFAGALLVRNDQQLKILKDQGPMTILKNVAMPAAVTRAAKF